MSFSLVVLRALALWTIMTTWAKTIRTLLINSTKTFNYSNRGSCPGCRAQAWSPICLEFSQAIQVKLTTLSSITTSIESAMRCLRTMIISLLRSNSWKIRWAQAIRSSYQALVWKSAETRLQMASDKSQVRLRASQLAIKEPAGYSTSSSRSSKAISSGAILVSTISQHKEKK